MKKLFLLLVTVAALGIAAGFTVSARAEESGTCGEDLTWTLDDSGRLTISGTGSMDDYGMDAPWGTGVKKAVIEYGVERIGNLAFFDCSELESVDIPSTVTDIGFAAFNGCTKLQSVLIPDGITDIDNYMFCSCSSLTSVNLPISVTRIGMASFYGCTALQSITIPGNATNIYGEAFGACSALTNVTISEGVTSIDGYAFRNCTSLARITIPDSVTSIGSDAFSGCSAFSLVRFYSAETRDRFAAQLTGLNLVVCCKTEDHKYAEGSSECTVCGHTHLFVADWAKDPENHWRVCTKEECMDQVDLGPHIPDAHGVCVTCGYKCYTPGDSDGDGNASDWDGVLLKRYLAGWATDVDVRAFDIDGDGRITDWDSVLFDRYLAGWKVECLLNQKENHSGEIILPIVPFNSSRTSAPAGKEISPRKYIAPKRRMLLLEEV